MTTTNPTTFKAPARVPRPLTPEEQERVFGGDATPDQLTRLAAAINARRLSR